MDLMVAGAEDSQGLSIACGHALNGDMLWGMRPFGSPKTLERRRRRAVALLQQGLSVREVARRVQASVRSVSQWRNA
jgi:hypothetical protein